MDARKYQHIPRPRYHDADTDTWLTTDRDFADAKIGVAGVSTEGLTLCFWDKWGCEPTIAFFFWDELNIKTS